MLACLRPTGVTTALVLALVLMSGCGSRQTSSLLPPTVPASGLVTLDGKPLSSATVTFIPTGATPGSECVGATDETGHYKLQQFRGAEGAPPGEYRVTVSQYVGPGGKPIVITLESPPADQGAVEGLPGKFSNPTTSILKATVPPEGGEFNFELKSK